MRFTSQILMALAWAGNQREDGNWDGCDRDVDAGNERLGRVPESYET